MLKLKNVGCYSLGDTLGRGAFGRVYKGFNTETGDLVAIKKINKNALSAKHLPRILAEGELLRTLDHKNVVQLKDRHETPVAIYYVLEYMESGSLTSLAKRYGNFNEALLRNYTAQVLEGLAYLHSKGVIHRDIKGSNILVTKDGTVKLADFGSVAAPNYGTMTGTPHWMAPEVINLERTTFAADIWSVGCTCLELFTGSPPYYELGAMQAMYRISEDQQPPLPEIASPAFRDFLECCFIHNPAGRPPAAALLEHPWITKTASSRSRVNSVVDRPLTSSLPEVVPSLESNLTPVEEEPEEVKEVIYLKDSKEDAEPKRVDSPFEQNGKQEEDHHINITQISFEPPQRTTEDALKLELSDSRSVLQRSSDQNVLQRSSDKNVLQRSSDQNATQLSADQNVLQRSSDQNVLQRSSDQNVLRLSTDNEGETPRSPLQRSTDNADHVHFQDIQLTSSAEQDETVLLQRKPYEEKMRNRRDKRKSITAFSFVNELENKPIVEFHTLITEEAVKKEEKVVVPKLNLTPNKGGDFNVPKSERLSTKVDKNMIPKKRHNLEEIVSNRKYDDVDRLIRQLDLSTSPRRRSSEKSKSVSTVEKQVDDFVKRRLSKKLSNDRLDDVLEKMQHRERKKASSLMLNRLLKKQHSLDNLTPRIPREPVDKAKPFPDRVALLSRDTSYSSSSPKDRLRTRERSYSTDYAVGDRERDERGRDRERRRKDTSRESSKDGSDDSRDRNSSRDSSQERRKVSRENSLEWDRSDYMEQERKHSRKSSQEGDRVTRDRRGHSREDLLDGGQVTRERRRTSHEDLRSDIRLEKSNSREKLGRRDEGMACTDNFEGMQLSKTSSRRSTVDSSYKRENSHARKSSKDYEQEGERTHRRKDSREYDKDPGERTHRRKDSREYEKEGSYTARERERSPREEPRSRDSDERRREKRMSRVFDRPALERENSKEKMYLERESSNREVDRADKDNNSNSKPHHRKRVSSSIKTPLDLLKNEISTDSVPVFSPTSSSSSKDKGRKYASYTENMLSSSFPVQEYLRRTRSDISRAPPEEDRRDSPKREPSHANTPTVRGRVEQYELALKAYSLQTRPRSSTLAEESGRPRRDSDADEWRHTEIRPLAHHSKRSSMADYGRDAIDAVLRERKQQQLQQQKSTTEL